MVSYYNRYNSTGTWTTLADQTPITSTAHSPSDDCFYYEESTNHVTPAIKIKPMTFKTYIEEQKLVKQEVLKPFPIIFKEPQMFNNQNKHVDPKNRLLSKLGKGLHSYQ